MKSLISLLIAAVALSVSCIAQGGDTIVANPNAIKFRRIWTWLATAEQQYLGTSGGSVGDVNGDGLSDFGVLWFPRGPVGAESEFRVYYGGSPEPDTTADWSCDTIAADQRHPVFGDFWGDGGHSVVLTTGLRIDTNQTHVDLYGFLVFRVDSNRLPNEPTIRQPLGQLECVREELAADLDSDGADELIVGVSCDAYTEIVIYRGGSDFQLDSPTVVIRDTGNISFGVFYVSVGDVDGDKKPDLLTSGDYTPFEGGAKLNIWLGSTGSIWRGDQPDYEIPFTEDLSNPVFYLLNADGDGKADLLRGLGGGEKFGAYLFISSEGGAITERSLLVDSADRQWKQKDLLRYETAGYLLDSTRTYEGTMLFIDHPTLRDGRMVVLSGSKDGPNSSYDGYYLARLDGLGESTFGRASMSMSDCNGDGWDDYFTANSGYGGFYRGIATVLAGGPYIPHEDSASSVRDIAVTGKPTAISIWPNPVHNELNIAWRGDLQTMPRRFQVHSSTGELVARGEVAPGIGAAIWNCSGVPSGSYILSIFAADGSRITSTPFVKR